MAQVEVLADLDEVPPNSPRWHELRRLGIGGSDAGAIVGVSRFKTPYQVWVEKMSEGTVIEEDSEPAQWGKILERPVRDEFSRRTGIEVIDFPKMVRHAQHQHMLANVDGLSVETKPGTGLVTGITGIYEGKTSRYDWSDDGAVVIPPSYAVQGYHYMAVLELDIVHYACLIGGQKLVVAELERDDKMIEDLMAIEAAFWAQVVDGTPPPAEAADVDTLRRRWTPETGKSVELTAELAMELKRRKGLKEAISSAEGVVKEIDAKLMEFMGDAEVATWREQTAITWKLDQKGKLQGRELERKRPDIYAEFLGEPSRRFLPKELTA